MDGWMTIMKTHYRCCPVGSEDMTMVTQQIAGSNPNWLKLLLGPWERLSSINCTNCFQFAAVTGYTHMHAHTHTHTTISVPPINYIYLGHLRKPNYAEKTHTYLGRTCKLHTDSTRLPYLGIKPSAFCNRGNSTNL